MQSVKQLPRAIEAERNILASIVIDPRIISRAVDLITSNDFYEDRHKIIFDAMVSLYNEKIEIAFPILIDKLNQRDQLNKVGGHDYLYDLVNEIPSSYYFDSYLDILLDASLKRDIIKLNQEMLMECYKNEKTAVEYLDMFEQKVFMLSKRRKSEDFISVSNVARRYYKFIEDTKRANREITGLDTGYEKLNKILNGFNPEELIILAARPGVGKSAFAIQLALNVVKAFKPTPTTKKVAFFSLEMSNQQLVSRMVSNIGGLDSNKLRIGNLDQTGWLKFNTAVEQLSKCGIYFDDATTIKTSDIRAKCRKLQEEKGLDLIIIDYLQLLSAATQSRNKIEEVTKISRDLKQMAKELKIPVIALSQLSRSTEKTDDKIPKLSHLRESGSIEQDADIVLFLHRDDYYNKAGDESDNKMSLIVAKNRQGISGVMLDFLFHKEETRFIQRDNREE